MGLLRTLGVTQGHSAPLSCSSVLHCPVAQSEMVWLASSKMVIAAHQKAEAMGRVSLGKLQLFRRIRCPELLSSKALF